MSRQTVFGKLSSTGITMHIDDVNKQVHNSFICAECGSALTPVKTDARKKDWHFRHPNNSGIIKCRQRGLHDFAAQVIFDSNEIQISKSERIAYTNPRKETWIEKLYRSDVSASYANEIVHFEVFVTSDLSAEKVSYYNNNLLKCVKIDLSKERYLSMPKEELIKLILDSTHNKTMYGWNEILETAYVNIAEKPKSFWERYWPQIFIGLLLFIIGFVLFKPNRKKVWRA